MSALPEGSRAARLAARAVECFGVDLPDYWALHRWSIERPEQFWGLVWNEEPVLASRPYARVLGGGPMPDQRWFEGARLNYVEHVLRWDRPGPAVVSLTEGGDRVEVSWAELRDQVRSFAGTLRRLGVRPGDRVVGYVTNGVETIIAFLGTAALGAIWAGCAPDFGLSTAASRLGQLEPTVLVAMTGYTWNGADVDRRDVVSELAQRLGVAALVTVERCGHAPEAVEGVRTVTWDEAVAGPQVEVAHVDGDHPLWVLFSSGTTGVPKGIVHSHAGVLAAHLALLRLQHDLDENSTLFWYTTPNWMMWNIIVSALLTGATTVCYEGAPVYPGPQRLWEIVADEGVTMFGTSPGHLQAGRAVGLHPAADLDLGRLSQIAATGAPVPASLNEWVRAEVGPDVPLISTCGGTDVVSGFLGAAPGVPIRDGEITGPLLGVAAAAFDDHGRPVRDQVGELVITAPYPSMPVMFWNDPDGSRYRAAYFETFPGVWRQGDWATETSAGSFVVHGRSDSTLNRNGVRIGSSDLYDIVERDPDVAEALVLGVEMPNGSYRMPMFVVPAPGRDVDDAVIDRLRTSLRTQGSPRHVPDEFHVVEAIPHTRTGKKLEVPLKRILQGADPAAVLDPGTIDRPDLVERYVDLARRWHGEG